MKSRMAVVALGFVLVSMAFLQRPPPIPTPVVAIRDGASDIAAPDSGNELPSPQVDGSVVIESAPLSGEESGEIPVTVRWTDQCLLRLARMQNSDGSWGEGPELLGDAWLDRTGITALVMLGFIHRGYSHLSSDEYEGIKFGTVVKNGLKWFLKRQGADGSFATGGGSDLDHILATLALSEAYGQSATQLVREPAQRSVDALARIFANRSGWGGDAQAAWAALAASSARYSELEVDESFVSLNLHFLEGVSGSKTRPLAAAAWGLLRHDRIWNEWRSESLRRLESSPDLVDLQIGYFDGLVIERGRNAQHEDVREVRRARLISTWERGKKESLQIQGRPGEYAVRMSLWMLNIGALQGYGP